MFSSVSEKKLHACDCVSIDRKKKKESGFARFDVSARMVFGMSFTKIVRRILGACLVLCPKRFSSTFLRPHPGPHVQQYFSTTHFNFARLDHPHVQ